jgi:tripartite-type tricarboxylate transporter receptor subunit TctC
LVENRAGAGGIVAAQAITQAPADGYTLFFAAASALVIAPHVQAALPYDPTLDFSPVAFVAEIPLVIDVTPTIEAPTLSALIARAGAQPGGIEYAANSPGTFPHLATELLAARANVQLTYVPYKGVAQALPDVAGGRIVMVVEGLAGLASAIKAREVRAPNFPDLPTASETVRDYRAIGWFAVMARSGTPESVLTRLHEELSRVVASSETASALQALSSYPRPMSREALAAFIRDEHKLWGDVVKRIGFKPH